MQNQLQLENMRKWEETIMVIKRHWVVYIILWLYAFFVTMLSIVLYSILWFTTMNNLFNILLWLFFAVFIYIEWLNHELDMYVVTNNRVIWIDQIAFLNRTVSECNLWQVQEVNSKTSWLVANLLNYWTLSIQTAWNQTTLKMDYSPDAMQWARKILNIVDDYRDNQSNNNLQTEEIS